MTIGSHQRTVGLSQTHFTPHWIIDRLGPFDLDPCAGDPRPWDCAAQNYTAADDGLAQPWQGRVWLNPPFDRYQVGRWLARLADHGDGIALLHARTETAWFQKAWTDATSMLFLGTRIHFHKADGAEHPANSGAPVVLVAFGRPCARRLDDSGLAGAIVRHWDVRP